MWINVCTTIDDEIEIRYINMYRNLDTDSSSSSIKTKRDKWMLVRLNRKLVQIS